MRTALYCLFLGCCVCGQSVAEQAASVPLESVLMGWEHTMVKSTQKVYSSDTLVVFCSKPSESDSAYWCVQCYRYIHGGWVPAELFAEHSAPPTHWSLENGFLIPYRGNQPITEVTPISVATPKNALFLFQMIPVAYHSWGTPQYEDAYAELLNPQTYVVRMTKKWAWHAMVYHTVLSLRDSRWQTVGAFAQAKGFDEKITYRLLDNEVQCVDESGLLLAGIPLNGGIGYSPQYVQMRCVKMNAKGYATIRFTNTLNRTVRILPGLFILSPQDADGTLYYADAEGKSEQDIILPPHAEKSVCLKVDLSCSHASSYSGTVQVSYLADSREPYSGRTDAHEWMPYRMESTTLPAVHPNINVYALNDNTAISIRFDPGMTSGIDSSSVSLSVYQRKGDYWSPVGNDVIPRPNRFHGCCRLQGDTLQYGQRAGDGVEWFTSIPLKLHVQDDAKK